MKMRISNYEKGYSKASKVFAEEITPLLQDIVNRDADLFEDDDFYLGFLDSLSDNGVEFFDEQ